MRRRRQYLSVLRTLTERQAKEAAERLTSRIAQRKNWYEYMDESNLLSCYWIDIYWRNRNRMGLYSLPAVIAAGAFEVMDVRAVKGNG